MQDDELSQLAAEEFELKQELLRLGQLREQDYKDRALEYFVPHSKQLQFFQAAATRHRAGFCGNRFGKTTTGTVEDCCWLVGERPFFPVGHPLRRLGIPEHGVKGFVLSEDWDKVHELFTNEGADRPGKFFEFLPRSKISGTTRMQKGVINSITVTVTLDGRKRESILVFDTVRSFINNPRSFESSDWDFIHVDEPIPEDLWNAVSRGFLDRGGFAWWLLTPLGFPWMYDKMLENTALDSEAYWMFEADMDDNPLLDEKAKLMYLAQLPEEERDCRKKGTPLAYGRRVYGHFNEKLHVWSKPTPPAGWLNMNTPPKEYMCKYALDPHPQTPHAVLFMAISPFGDIFFYFEISRKGLIRDLALDIVEARDKVRCVAELCDPSAWIENPDTGHSWSTTLYEYGLNVIRASKDKSDGIIQTQQIWSPSFGRSVWVMPQCRQFIKEIKAYFFDRENKPVDKNDHMMENMYRLVMDDPSLSYISPTSNTAPLKVRDPIVGAQNYNLAHQSNYNL